MQIIDAQVSLDASHSFTETTTRTERVEAWVDPPAANSADEGGRATVIQLSEAAREALNAAERLTEDAAASIDVAEEEDPARGDPRLAAAILLIEMFTGRRVQLMDPADLQVDPETQDPSFRRDGSEQHLAQQRAMSFRVGEDGSAGTTRRLDMAV